jgi:superfamily II DNA or RNA helicase
MDNVFIYHIGKIISKDTKLDRQPKVITLKYSGKNASHLGCIYNGKLSLGKYLNKIYKLSERNMLIAKSIHNAYLKNREILCLSDRISQLHLLKDILIKHCEIAEEDIGLFTSIIKQENKKVILATYGSAGMGVDIPRLDTIIFATPRVHVTQAVGRILRDNYKDKKESIVIDIIDTNSSIMTSWFYSRVKLYKTLKAEIIYGK